MATKIDKPDNLLYYSDKYNKCFMIDDQNNPNFDIEKNFTVNGVYDKQNKVINKENTEKYLQLLYDVLVETHQSISVNVDANLTKYLNISEIINASKNLLCNDDNSIRDLRKKLFECQKMFTDRLGNIQKLQNELVDNHSEKKRLLITKRVFEMIELIKDNSSEDILKQLNAYDYIITVMETEKGITSSDIWRSHKGQIIDVVEKFKDSYEKSIDNKFVDLIKKLKVTSTKNVRKIICILSEMSHLDEFSAKNNKEKSHCIGFYINEYIFEEQESLEENSDDHNLHTRLKYLEEKLFSKLQIVNKYFNSQKKEFSIDETISNWIKKRIFSNASYFPIENLDIFSENMNKLSVFLGEPDQKWKVYVYSDLSKKSALVEKSRIIEIIRKLEGMLQNIEQKLNKVSSLEELLEFLEKKFQGSISENLTMIIGRIIMPKFLPAFLVSKRFTIILRVLKRNNEFFCEINSLDRDIKLYFYKMEFEYINYLKNFLYDELKSLEGVTTQTLDQFFDLVNRNLSLQTIKLVRGIMTILIGNDFERNAKEDMDKLSFRIKSMKVNKEEIEYSVYLLKFQNLKQDYTSIQNCIEMPVNEFMTMALSITENFIEVKFEQMVKESDDENHKEILLHQKNIDMAKLQQIFE